jgi:gas vesicle protein
MINKLTAYFLIGGFILGDIFILIKASNKIAELRYEIKQLQAQLQNCKDTNQQLINQIQLQQDQYNKAMKELQEASIKPVKKVYVKQVVKEPVYITNQDCQQMADLINQAQEQMEK